MSQEERVGQRHCGRFGCDTLDETLHASALDLIGRTYVL
jgi:hypothetical protein